MSNLDEPFDYDELARLKIEKIVVELQRLRRRGLHRGDHLDTACRRPGLRQRALPGDSGSGLQHSGEPSRRVGAINEGPHGHITIDVKERTAFLHHGENVVTTHWHDATI